ncbi:receptor L domain protein [Oesophagostomum dentatum]|uniref:Receptor L domain protein n=1 Tax=Oesophagostomum dentatum TaxID=61180 RepID=A0A0B1SYL4_OESDE|nr:receptor L domain protein [Oesophagostomum dentatum]
MSSNIHLCSTVSEMDALLTSHFVNRVEGRICTDIGSNETAEHVCRIGDMALLDSIPGDCYTLVGHLTIDYNSPKQELWKLYNVTRIYGSLTIRNTTLIGLSPFWKLVDIYNLEAFESALVIESNPRLRSMYMGGIDRVLSGIPTRVSDSPQLMMTTAECESLLTYTRVDFYNNKHDCIAAVRHLRQREEPRGELGNSEKRDCCAVMQDFSTLRDSVQAPDLRKNYRRLRKHCPSLFEWVMLRYVRNMSPLLSKFEGL